jgi:hypothetical protein
MSAMIAAPDSLRAGEEYVLEDSRFDRLSRQLAGGGSRRNLLRAITGVSLVGTGALLVAEEGDAKARRGSGVQSEHFRHKKVTYCLDGQTIRRYRRKQKKLLAKGATRGKCTKPVCTPDCTGKACGPDGCGGSCGPGCTGVTCCTSEGTCVVGSTNEACGTGGNMCQVCVEPETCVAAACINIT